MHWHPKFFSDIGVPWQLFILGFYHCSAAVRRPIASNITAALIVGKYSAIFTRAGMLWLNKAIEGSLRQIDRSGYLKIPLKQYWNLLVEYLKPQRSCVAMLGIALYATLA